MLRSMIVDDKMVFLPFYESPTVKISFSDDKDEEKEKRNNYWKSLFLLDNFYNKRTTIPNLNIFDKGTTSVNEDPELQSRVTNAFYEKLNEWLKKEQSILRYFDVTDNNVTFVKSLTKLSPPDNLITATAKVTFIFDQILTKHAVKKVLKHYVAKNNVNWFDLPTVHKHAVKHYLLKKIENHIIKLVSSQH